MSEKNLKNVKVPLKLIRISPITPRAVKVPLSSVATPLSVFWPILIGFDTVWLIREHETIEYIPSPFRGRWESTR